MRTQDAGLQVIRIDTNGNAYLWEHPDIGFNCEGDSIRALAALVMEYGYLFGVKVVGESSSRYEDLEEDCESLTADLEELEVENERLRHELEVMSIAA